ncbi:ATP-dependent DNA helicase RecG [Sterolibacterium denitrificans]|uniref:ATP-dependent DNA helicase RecG n=1 Tax=Sterolibacterium denitrificans TaxID=157592 RepID=A0A7Z7MUV7_9PROT|nr:ATP-dependent DNA helicase RecG [Sterolibacterium denitrificans]SMB22830.1 ATP-dependent DNA helicase RecG [Sterolibacterium denitrificans]
MASAAKPKSKPEAKAAHGLSGRLAKLGIRSDAELILHLPLRYEDETCITPLDRLHEAPPGEPIQVEVEVVSTEIAFRPRRQLISRVRDARAGDGMLAGVLVVRLLNFYPSQQKQYAPGARLRLFGEVRDGYFGPEMVHPRAVAVTDDTPLPSALTPIYPTTAGLAQGTLRRLIERALQRVALTDTLPDEIRAAHGLMPFGEAIRMLHQPPAALSAEALEARNRAAWRRIRFDELLAQQISLRRAYTTRRAHGAPRLAARTEPDALTERFLDALPFRLTVAQQRAWREIAADLAQPHPMQRLLQGDVGSGKTVIAALAMLQAVDNGWQGAMMAPTEILAEQHYGKLSQWLASLGVEVAWLAGSLKKARKTAMLEAVRSGRAAVAVGTHALIEECVDFARLGVAVVDEQHRFGVRQRLSLRQKGKAQGSADSQGAPHQLMMSATPIPRSLAMSYYADLDVSVIDELPPGRTPVATRLVADGRRGEVVSRVHLACSKGRQAYWVCPLIEESETLQLQTALDTYERLGAELPDLRVGLVHGRLKPAEKSAVMAAFVANEIQVLVATTVIEVGVDVPNASLMVIEHAERFGLAQLHQLRGRVGRGAAESTCVLLYSRPLGQMARDRLKVIYENTDGFEIARQDLALRGPGEFIGARQSGMPLLRYADLDDAELVERARQVAEQLMRDHPVAERAHLQRWLAGREELLKA